MQVYKSLAMSDRDSGNMDVYPSLLPFFQQGVLMTAVGLLLYALIGATYNIFFHPLSRFPGPRGAACTRWWLAYMELGRGVSLSTLRADLHQKYGTSSMLSPPIAGLTLAKVTLFESRQMR